METIIYLIRHSKKFDMDHKINFIGKKPNRQIITERNIMKDLYFPFISNLYCTFQDSLNIYFVFDYFCGGDLRYYLIKGIKFTENQIKFVLGCIILSLEYIHSKKVIHRDIKPENLLFDDRGYVYLCDFGISIKENPNERPSAKELLIQVKQIYNSKYLKN